MCGEWWCSEGLTAVTARLPDAPVALAAHATLYNLTIIVSMIFQGLGDATCAVIGKSVGAGRPTDAPHQYASALAICAPLAAAVGTGLYYSSPWLARFFTQDVAVQQLIEQTALGPALTVAAYAVLFTAFGACRGANRRGNGPRVVTTEVCGLLSK